LARHVGACQVIAATSGGVTRAQRAVTLGAHAAVDYTRPGWTDEVKRLTDGRGVDVLFEATGGSALEDGLQALAPFGRAVVYGAASGVDATLSAAALRSLFYDPALNQCLIAFNVGSWFMQRPETASAAIGELMGWVGSGAIRMPSIQTLPLSDAARAHHLLESRQASGKLVLKPWA
jgi:NADPH:quinone reductase